MQQCVECTGSQSKCCIQCISLIQSNHCEVDNEDNWEKQLEVMVRAV
jgi:hypothetical protein